MRLRTLILYLIGSRQAILEIAANRRALWIGLLFVFSAVFAREYDGHYLIAEPWHLLIPFGASLLASFLLFLVVCGHLFQRRKPPSFFKTYRSFLALFWLTSPLTCLLAIPYERFLSAAETSTAHVWTLVFVAIWWVALMVRVTSAITKRALWTSFCMVLCFSDTAVILLSIPGAFNTMAFMAPIGLSEPEAIARGAECWMLMVALISLPICFYCASIAPEVERPFWQPSDTKEEKCSISRGMWILATLSLLIWLPILPWTQREQELRYFVERELKAGRVDEALDFMSAHRQEEFPPQWVPPRIIENPRRDPRYLQTNILEVMERIVARNSAHWVRELYCERFRLQLKHRDYLIGPPEELSRIANVFRNLPEGRAIAAKDVDEVVKGNPHLDMGYRQQLQHFLDLVGKPGE